MVPEVGSSNGPKRRAVELLNMNLVESSQTTPPDGIVSPVIASDRVLLRTARWPPASHGGRPVEPLGTVLICAGRSEFIEKYFEVVEELRQRGFQVVVLDWRGQGLSGRLLRNPRKGHVRGFADYELDLAAVVQQVLEPFCPRPWFGLAHSMGGSIALHFAANRPEVFQRLVLSAPMIEIAGLPSPDLVRTLARALRWFGLGGSFVPVGRRRSLFLGTFEGNVLTSDPARFERTAALLRAEPRLLVGTPTVGWLNAAFEAMAALNEDEFGRRFRTPTLVVMPGADRVVDARAAERLVARLRASSLVVVPHARHEILMERDSLRQQFWAAFDAFVPGSLVAGTPAGRDALPSRRVVPV